jgi:O-antigen/teichoic acid export membrane protein
VSCLPLMVHHVARTTIYSFDIVLIAILLYRADVGFYGAAYKPILFVSTVTGLFTVSFLASYSAPAAERVRAALFSRALRLLLAATVAIALALSILSGTFVSLLYGDAYAPAAGALAILAWTLPVLALQGLYGNALIAGERQKLLMRHNIAGAAFNVLANFGAIPLAGIEGAAAVTIASLLIVLVLNYRSAVALRLAPSLLAVRSTRLAGPVSEPAVQPVDADTALGRGIAQG